MRLRESPELATALVHGTRDVSAVSPTKSRKRNRGGLARLEHVRRELAERAERATARAKPPYVVPSMADVRAAESTNGLVVASLFAGAGGSSLGWRMAGYRVAFASEMDVHAVETYRANCGAHVDARDVRQLRGADLLEACGLRPGELDVLDGSPPC